MVSEGGLKQLVESGARDVKSVDFVEGDVYLGKGKRVY